MPITELCRLKINEYNDNDTRYRLANDKLYEIVRMYPLHTNADEIVTKLWIIGRTYAAAVERRNNKDLTPGDFYYDYVAPALMRLDENQSNILDEKINSLRDIEEPNFENLPRILSVHKYLVDLFEELTEKEKRSLASKYLHFHLPNLFFIYDSRVSSVITKFSGRRPHFIRFQEDCDKIYADYCYKALPIYNEIRDNNYTDSPIRVVDNILLRYCDEHNIANGED